MINDYMIKENDVMTEITFTLKETTSNTAVDLTNASSIAFYMKTSTGALKVSGTCSVVGTATDGVCQYTWAAGDLDTPGNYLGEVEVTFTDGTIATWPSKNYINIQVVSELGP